MCGQIIPWNFPLLMAAWKIAPALAAGCTVVLKPAEQTPAHRAAPRRAGARGRASRRACSTWSPATARPARRWSTTPAWTRSPSPARPPSAARSARRPGKALKRVTLELGGKSPNIILPDADLEAAIKGSFQAIYYNTGQACNAGSRLFVQKDQFDDGGVGAGRGRRAGQGRPRARRGHPARARSSPPSSTSACAATSRRASREGAELVAGGDGSADGERRLLRRAHPVHGHRRRPHDRPRGDLRPGARRAALRGPRRGRRGAPTTPSTAWPPASGRATWRKAHTLAAKLRAGSVYVNVWGPSDAAAPFGGFKASGIGREHGAPGSRPTSRTRPSGCRWS